MSDEKPLIFPLAGPQRPAVEPAETVWLSASAGTGKTQVLSARVLRLLLQEGVRPEQLLCLTFTKAGATEMAGRVNEVLASWVRMPAIRLFNDLEAIGAPSGPDAQARARTLFAAVLDCPGGGLKIQTIHAFAQWLLSAFPLEAGMMPGTRAMEDRDRDLLVRQVLADLPVQAVAQGNTRLIEALELLSLRMTAEQLEGWLLRCAKAHGLWFGTGAWQVPLRPRIDRLLGLGEDAAAGLIELCGDAEFDCAGLRQVVTAQASWATKTGLGAADCGVGWLMASPVVRLERLDELYKALFTLDGAPRSLTAMLKQDADYESAIERVRASLSRAIERRALIALADLLEPALTLGRKFALAWDEAKAREGFIDFDDQIRHAARLLKEQADGEWVRFKLDRRFDHILVDEAQDTNEAQWDIIDALIEDFFAGQGQRGDALRTLFVVGDYKQAIFRFQGTSPENFRAAKERVRQRMLGVERDLLDLGLGRSFRSSQPVLDFVDRAIALIGPERFGLDAPPERHVGSDGPGLVTLWRPVGVESDEPDEEGEPGDEGWLSRPDRMLADKIALQVRRWMDEGFSLTKGGLRRAGPGDVMVLVRKRKELAGLIVARLHARGVPVAGVDRLRLGAPLGVKDLVAALRFAAQPLDDLNLANLLVSPLIGWSQEDLLEFGYRVPVDGRRERLWEHLRRGGRPETLEKLLDLLRRADFEVPQALLHWLLVGPWQGRRKLVARLGREVEDPIDELLNAALVHAAGETSSLVGFLQWFDANSGELKREAGRNEGLARVMTVHGAKGLQAPIVILADAADDPDASPPRGLVLSEELPGTAPREVPLPPLNKRERVGAVEAAELRAKREEREEHWRLLYVAMTRAEEALFIGGSMGGRSKELKPESWYAALQPLFGEGLDDPLWGGRFELGERAPVAPAVVIDLAPIAELPEWATRAIGPEPRPPRPLAPSSSGEEDAADPPSGPSAAAREAAERGVLIHRLLERLPEVAAEARATAAKAWLARSAAPLSESARDEIVQAALAVLADPQWAAVFGPDSLPEVPLAATVGGRVIAGTIDRLVLATDTIRIVDYKTARRPPASLAQVPLAYVRQMAAYAAALRAIHPAMQVEAALLYTQTPQLIAIPADMLEAHKPGSSAGQESFAAPDVA